MSELCNSNIPFYTLLISDLFLFCSFILSHPLYFSYFIFFSPYIIKIVSFLSPLFITTFLLFFAFLTGFVHENFSLGLAQSRVSHQQTVCSTVLERLQSMKDVENEEFCCLEDLEMYKIVFGSSVMEGKGYQVEVLEENSGENPRLELESNVVEGLIQEEQSISKCEDFMVDEVKESSVLGSKLDIVNADEKEQKRLENFLKILDEFERMTSSVEEKKVEPPLGTKIDKDFGKHDAVQLVRNGSEAMADKRNVTTGNCGKEYNSKVEEHFEKPSSVDDYTDANDKDDALKVKNSSQKTWDSDLGTYGSMRKEKEWKRTLACKLFEERHNANGGDGMDSLWETYETDSTKLKSKNDKRKKNKKKIQIEAEEECGNEEEINGQLCCLQAFKLSAGKMNLGVGRPNLVKISKAIKGLGWLHHVSKHNKKVHNNGDRY